jgi:hypothetical protein
MQFTTVLPALIGIALGRNPSGFLSDAFGAWGTMIRDTTRVFIGAVAVELVAWFLAFRHTISNWNFAIFTMALVLLLPRVPAAVTQTGRRRGDALDREPGSVGDPIPLELLGIDRAFTSTDLREINRGLGLEQVRA